jgi:hypothetical protein
MAQHTSELQTPAQWLNLYDTQGCHYHKHSKQSRCSSHAPLIHTQAKSKYDEAVP